MASEIVDAARIEASLLFTGVRTVCDQKAALATGVMKVRTENMLKGFSMESWVWFESRVQNVAVTVMLRGKYKISTSLRRNFPH